jgi:hypothetical protein
MLPELYVACIHAILRFPVEFALYNPSLFSSIPPPIMNDFLNSIELCASTDYVRYLLAAFYHRSKGIPGPQRADNFGTHPEMFSGINLAAALEHFLERGHTLKTAPNGLKSKHELILCRRLLDRKVVLSDLRRRVYRYSVMVPCEALSDWDGANPDSLPTGQTLNFVSESFSLGKATFVVQMSSSPQDSSRLAISLVRIPENPENISERASAAVPVTDSFIPPDSGRMAPDEGGPIDYYVNDDTPIGITVNYVIPAGLDAFHSGHAYSSSPNSAHILNVNESIILAEISPDSVKKLLVYGRRDDTLVGILEKVAGGPWDGIAPLESEVLASLKDEVVTAKILSPCLCINFHMTLVPNTAAVV